MMDKDRDCSNLDPSSEEYRECRRQEEVAKMLRQEQQQTSMPSPAMMSKFMPQGGGAAGSGAGGSGGGSALAGAGPYAALAAVIAANETGQRKAGNRPDSMGAQIGEAIRGEGLVRDVDRLTGDNKFANWLAQHGNPEGLGRNIEKSLKPWELLEELF